MIKEYPFGVYDLEYAIKLCTHVCVVEEIVDPKTITNLCFSTIEVSVKPFCLQLLI